MSQPQPSPAEITAPPRTAKVLHIAQRLPGGIISYIEELLPTQIAHYGAENVHALVGKLDVELMAMLPPSSVHTFPKVGRSFRELFNFARSTVAVVRSEKPDIIHLHSTFAGLLRPVIAMAARGRRPAIIYCAHGWAFNMRTAAWKKDFYAFVERLLAPIADHIICISDFEYRSAIARGIPAKRMTMIENAITASPPPAGKAPFRRSPGNDTIDILFIGRFDIQKGFDIAEDAMEELQDAPVTLHAVGGHVVNQEAANGCGHKGLPNIIYYGWQDRRVVYDFIDQADALVMPSRWEGFGIVAIEAMRQGKAVIATNVDALPDIIIDGVTGLIVPAEDPCALAKVLRGLDKAQLARMGQAAREHFLARFTSERLNREILQAYRLVTER